MRDDLIESVDVFRQAVDLKAEGNALPLSKMSKGARKYWLSRFFTIVSVYDIDTANRRSRLDFCTTLAGRPITTTNDLTGAEIAALCDCAGSDILVLDFQEIYRGDK